MVAMLVRQILTSPSYSHLKIFMTICYFFLSFSILENFDNVCCEIMQFIRGD